MPDFRSRLDTQIGQLPISLVAWGYNLRRAARLLWPVPRYPLADKADALSCQPLIYISSGRTGTTLLRSMLAMGGEIAIPPESFTLAFTALQFQAMQEQSWYNLVRIVISQFEGIQKFREWELNLHPVYLQARTIPESERSLARIIDLVYLHYASVHFPEATVWGDQSPFNTRRLPWIMSVFPQGKYLNMMRDGRDVVASYKEKGSRNETIEWAIERWQFAIRAGQMAQKRLPPESYLAIRYEDLVAYPEDTLQEVCAFVGISYTATMLDYWKSPTTIESRYHEHHRNLNRPVFSSSIGRWKERLDDSEKALVLQHLEPTLREIGYIQD